jgi:hypothetical protein
MGDFQLPFVLKSELHCRGLKPYQKLSYIRTYHTKDFCVVIVSTIPEVGL